MLESKLKSWIAKWKGRRTYRAFVDMPSSLVALFGLGSFMAGAFYGQVLKKVAPDAWEIANRTPFRHWGWRGWLVAVVVIALLLMVGHFGSVAWRCQKILRDRWYP